MADFTGDGVDEILFRHHGSGENRLWTIENGVRTSSIAIKAAHPTWRLIAVGDFDGDGKQDLLWRNTSGANILWFMNSETISSRVELPNVSTAWQVSGTGDFDADGSDDLLWHNASGGKNSVWLLNAFGRKSRASIPGTGSGWTPFAVFDMDVDGKADILFRNSNDGSNRLWLMDGTSRQQSLAITKVGDQNWQPVAVGNIGSNGAQSISSGSPLQGSVGFDTFDYFSIDVEANTTVDISVTGLSSDIDLYVGDGSEPTLQSYDCSSFLGGSQSETCSLVASSATTVFIGVYGFSAGSYTVTATATSSNDQQPPIGGSDPDPSTGVFDGIVSYNKITPTLTTNPSVYRVSIDLHAFDANSKEPADLTSLNTSAHNLSVPGSSSRLGTQRYTVDSLSCSSSGTQDSYDAVMLFDRSGSMDGNDPYDESLDAAREFVNSLGFNDRAMIAEFSGSSTNFISQGFTSSINSLLSHISQIKSPSGATPLWDSMLSSISKFESFSSSKRALLAFSDGQDTASSSSSISVKNSAIQNNVSVFAINLRNSNSTTLDNLALDTGGSVYSTDDASRLIKYYGVLGKLLSGDSTKCTVDLTVQFTAESGFGEVGYGPASYTTPTFSFDASTPGATGTLETTIRLPLYPGRKIGETASSSVFETDVSNNHAASECVDIGSSTFRNACLATIYAVVCQSSDANNCVAGVLSSGNSTPLPGSGGVNYTACSWKEPLDKYRPARKITGGTNFYREWRDPGENFTCLSNARF